MKKTTSRQFLFVLAVGLSAALRASAALALAMAAGWFYTFIAGARGWFAVLLFVVAAALTCATATVIYKCGAWIVQKGGFID